MAALTPTGSDDPFVSMTTDHPSPYLAETRMTMLGRIGDAPTRRKRVLARLVATLVLLPFPVGTVAVIVDLVT